MAEYVTSVEISEMDHSRIHGNGIEHEHTENPYGIHVIVRATFDDSRLVGILPMLKSHDLRWAQTIYVPAKDETGDFVVRNGIYDDGSVSSGTCKPNEDSINLVTIAQHRAKDSNTFQVNLDDVVDEIVTRMQDWEKVAPLVEAAEAERARLYALQQAKRDAEDQKRKEENARKDAAEKEAKEKAAKLFEETIATWTAENGSDRLKKGLAQGYRCRKIFITEFVEHELGDGWEIDWDKDVATKIRACPSLGALDVCEELAKNKFAINPRVVWLPEGLSALSIWNGSNGCEAVEVRVFGEFVYKTFSN